MIISLLLSPEAPWGRDLVYFSYITLSTSPDALLYRRYSNIGWVISTFLKLYRSSKTKTCLPVLRWYQMYLGLWSWFWDWGLAEYFKVRKGLDLTWRVATVPRQHPFSVCTGTEQSLGGPGGISKACYGVPSFSNLPNTHLWPWTP